MSSLEQSKKDLEELSMKTKKDLMNLDSNLSSSLNEKVNSNTVSLYESDIKNIQQQIKILDSKTKNFNSQLENKTQNLRKDTLDSQKSFLIKLKKIKSQIEEQLSEIEIKFKELKTKLNEEQSDDNTSDNESDLMLPKQQIVNLDYLVKSKNEHIENIYKKTTLVSQFSNEVNTFTVNQEEGIKDIEENIITVNDKAKSTVNLLLKTNQKDKSKQVNYCYLIILLTLILLFMIIYTAKNGL